MICDPSHIMRSTAKSVTGGERFEIIQILLINLMSAYNIVLEYKVTSFFFSSDQQSKI